MEKSALITKAQEYEKSTTGTEEKQRLTLAWEKHKEFLKIYPFRTNPAEIDNLTPVVRPEEFRKKALGLS